MLPGLSGLEVMEELRGDSATARIGVLMLTARREESDRIKGLTLGADDYLTKPFSPQELVLRVAAILRRIKSGQGTKLVNFLRWAYKNGEKTASSLDCAPLPAGMVATLQQKLKMIRIAGTQVGAA